MAPESSLRLVLTVSPGENVVPRVNNDWTLTGLTGAMVAALRAQERDVPAWLGLLAGEEAARKRGVEKAAFGMT